MFKGKVWHKSMNSRGGIIGGYLKSCPVVKGYLDRRQWMLKRQHSVGDDLCFRNSPPRDEEPLGQY